MEYQEKAGKKVIIKSLGWKTFERFGVQGIQFLIQIILARLLEPEDYGVITLLTIFITLSNVFVQKGFSTALIQKKDVSEVDFSTVFHATMAVAGVLYIILFAAAPLIADFYDTPELTNVLRVLAITLFFGALNSIQGAIIARRMEFKKAFICGLGAATVSGVVGITMAYAGAGYWALAGQQLSSAIGCCAIMWTVVKWRPKLLFSFKRMCILLNYGWKLLASGLLNTFFSQLGGLIIGKKYSTEDLSFYHKGAQFPSLLSTNLDGAIQSVMLPAYSQYQDEPQTVRLLMRRSIRLSTYLIFPMLFGLSAVAEPLVRLILTDKWLPCVPFMQLLCISYAFYPVHSTNLQAINALGHSEIFLKLEIIKKVYGTIIMLIAVQIGPIAMAASAIIGDVIGTFVNAAPNKKLLNYSYFDQWKDIMPSMLLSLMMMVVVRLVGLWNIHPFPLLVVEILVGVAVYVLGSMLFRLESFQYLLKQIRKK